MLTAMNALLRRALSIRVRAVARMHAEARGGYGAQPRAPARLLRGAGRRNGRGRGE